MPKLDKQDQRLADIFGTQDIPAVDIDTLERYLAYLKQHVAFPCQLTGIEDFDWEAYYVIGPGSQWEHERLRKTRPSYRDTYEWLSFDDDLDPDSGIFINVQRVSDKKSFVLPLADLKATKKKSTNYQLLDDFALWFDTQRSWPGDKTKEPCDAHYPRECERADLLPASRDDQNGEA